MHEELTNPLATPEAIDTLRRIVDELRGINKAISGIESVLDRAAPLQRPLQTVAKLEEESGATR